MVWTPSFPSWWLPLWWARSHPRGVIWTTAIISAAYVAAFASWAPPVQGATIELFMPVPVATAWAAGMYAFDAEGSRRASAWFHGAGAAGLIVIGSVPWGGTVESGTRVLVFNAILAGIALGRGLKSVLTKDQRAAAARAEVAERAVAAERLRIARDLHDALAHRLTLVNAQAGVAQYLAAAHPEKAAEALAGITEHTEAALDELRATLGLLRAPRDGVADQDLAPVASVAHLDSLVASFRSAGASIETSVAGSATPLADHVDAAGYRIVQEALTNAIKHAASQPITLALRWSDSELHLRITNDLVPGALPGPGTGQGLLGMAERAHAAGGAVSARAHADGSFIVDATLPVSGGGQPS